MKLISNIVVKEFRSIQDSQETLASFGNYNAFAGLNNSGKSNILRALNAFFTNRTDLDTPLDFRVDYNRFDLRKKTKNKAIEIAVTFTLPNIFKFRPELEPVHSYLGNTFTIKKRWDKSSKVPSYYLNDEDRDANLEERQKIDQFLGLINLRYIPNRVLPIDIIKNEHQALRDVLVRRLGKKGKESRKAFDIIQEISSGLIASLATRLKKVGIGSKTIRLDTPKDWADMIFAFGYRIGDGKVEIEDVAQGSGIQSLLMLETLYLIDKDYFQQFGWRQASVWAIEEPESSLHYSLEAQVASFLNMIALHDKSRLQVFATTHSDLITQYADKAFYVEMIGSATIIRSPADKKEVIEISSKSGLSRYVHPILYYPLDPILLVDGKYDVPFIKAAMAILDRNISNKVRVLCLEALDSAKTGGEDDILKYLKMNIDAICSRQKQAPIIILLDWESSKVSEFEKLSDKSKNRILVLKWKGDRANPKLGNDFRGAERFYPDRLIDLISSKVPNVIGTKDNGHYVIAKEDKQRIKKALFQEIEENGVQQEDIICAQVTIAEIIGTIKSLWNE